MVKKFNNRYDNLSPFRRILHKYTGFIVMGIFIAVVFTAWTMYDQETEFFHSWACDKLFYYMQEETTYGYTGHAALAEEKHLKLQELYDTDCAKGNFQPSDKIH